MQNLIPDSYHVNISNVLTNVTDLENPPLIHQRMRDIKLKPSTLIKYQKALNLVSRKLKLGWHIEEERI